MKNKLDTVILITGASSGIGKACAEYLSEKGYRVFGTSRKTIKSEKPYKMLKMDVVDDESVKETIKYIIEKENKIDVLINNAGIGIAGAVEDTSIEESKTQFETNFFGILRVCNAVLPFMRRQNNGLIINMSSISGLMGLPFQGLYSASKFAVEGISEALRLEVKKFGIKVVLIEPGDIKTEFAANRIKTEESQRNSVYQRQFEKTLNIIEHHENDGAKPQLVAQKVYKVIRSKSPKARYLVSTPIQNFAVILKKLLPSQLFEKILRGYYI